MPSGRYAVTAACACGGGRPGRDRRRGDVASACIARRRWRRRKEEDCLNLSPRRPAAPRSIDQSGLGSSGVDARAAPDGAGRRRR